MSRAHTYGWNYRELLTGFLNKGYEFRFFNELDAPQGQIALRHDVDFDTGLALESARTERELQIRSTYFFLLRSEFYNPFSGADRRNIMAIKELGHKISIHFDPTLYDDFHEGLKSELHIFEALFGEPVDIISFHRPQEFFLNYDQPIYGVEHTYQSKYLKDIRYFADSTGAWRYGHPFDAPEFAAGKTMHILTHPVWWTVAGGDNLEKLAAYFGTRKEHLKTLFKDNCIPFREISDRL